MRATIVSLVLSLALVSAAAAQPTAFTYQGQLKDGAQPASGPHDFRFRLWTAPTGGSQVGPTQCADDITVANGQFTTTIDFGQQFATSEPRFLEIDVRADTGLDCGSSAGFVTLAPRQPVTAAPAAGYARGASALHAPDGAPLNALIVSNDGRLGVGTGVPGAPLHLIAPNVGALPGEGIRIQGTQSTSANQAYLSFANGAGTAIGYVGDGGGGDNNVYLGSYGADIGLVNSTFGTVLIAKASGMVGIGTNTPSAKLEVHGDIRLGSSGQLRAAAGEENLRIIRGVVHGDGSIHVGTGFTVTVLGTGLYRINFQTPFAGAPAVTVSTQLSPTGSAITAEWLSLFSSRVDIRTRGFSTNLEPGDFSFIAVGPR